ncbi:MAG: exodeoxyribonuclease VII large subunit [Candidatus Omnitrophota bacterium]|nr:exodeoxyribonuclease VII large subunit [Candidatus Omnitrophota bacterium]
MPENQIELFQERTDLTKGRHIYTVSEITSDIKTTLKNTYSDVWVEGEITNFRVYPSGHFYFSLKDKDALLGAVMFRAAERDIKFKIEDGLSVICFGKIDVYAPRGEYKLITERIEPKGIGSLQLALEQLKKKLEKEGLFSAQHKRPIPYLPSRIGIVTSISGAAIKDILKVLERRFSGANIIINSVLVQGEGAKEEISHAIKDLNNFNESLPLQEKIEVLIVGRGGGSFEDLWAFNEEIVARSIYNSEIPVISAVGHERDWTIADLVSDMRAATPSSAAEMVMPKKEDLSRQLNDLAADLKRSFLDNALTFQERMDNYLYRLTLNTGHLIELKEKELDINAKKLLILNPVLLIQQYKLKITDLFKQACLRIQHFIELREAEFKAATGKLFSLSPLNILNRGYSITFKMPEEMILKDTKPLAEGTIIKTKVYEGEILSKVMEVK